MSTDCPPAPASGSTPTSASASAESSRCQAPPPPPSSPAHRPVRSFVLRAGRMGSGQERALRELAPLYCLPHRPGLLDTAAIFGRQAPCVVEIGFGMGQATAQIAAARPDLDFIGIEVHEAGVGALLREIGSRGLTNLRIIRHDAVEVLRERVAPGSLAGVHVFFPDPWHKKRHHKRRLIQPPLADLLASRLAFGGWLHCATDWQPYAEQILDVLSGCPALENTCGGYAPRPEMRPLTKFEARGLRLGHGVWDLLFRRRAGSVAGDQADAATPLLPAAADMPIK